MELRDLPISELLTKMRNTKAVGNAQDDEELWCVCDLVAHCIELPMEIRLESLAKMNELTGEDDPCTEAALVDYIEEMA